MKASRKDEKLLQKSEQYWIMGFSSILIARVGFTLLMLPIVTLVIEKVVDGLSTPVDTGVTIVDIEATMASTDLLDIKS